MKKILNQYLLLGSICWLTLLSSCNKDEEFSHDSGAPIVIENFIPTRGGGGTEVLITGSNFTMDTSDISLTINDVPLKIVGINGKQIMAVIPKKTGSGAIKIKIGNTTAASSTNFDYTYTKTVTTFAGSGEAGYLDGKGTDAQFNFTDSRCGLTVDNDLNIYVADAGNRCIRKITPDGNVTTLAGHPNNGGYGDGKGAAASFMLPTDVDVDNEGNVYSVDPYNWDIRKITPDGTASTIGWSIGSGATHIGVDRENSIVYYTSHDAGKINQLKPDGTHNTIIEGLPWPSDIAVKKNHDLIVVLHDQAQVGKYAAETWQQTIIAGVKDQYGYKNGPGSESLFSSPWCVALDNDENIYVAGNGTWDGSSGNADQSIRFIENNTWNVSSFAGSGTAGYRDEVSQAATFSAPTGVAVDKNGTVYVLDRKNNRIRKIISE